MPADRKYIGYVNRNRGAMFEKLIFYSCEYYSQNKIAKIEKTPEPVKILSGIDSHGRFTACFEKAAQPDFKGTLLGGRIIIFEAKHTETDRMTYDRVTKEQRAALDSYSEMGAECYVLCSFNLMNFYMIPWGFWDNMFEMFNRHYIKESDIQDCKVPQKNGMIMFLENIEGYQDGGIKKRGLQHQVF